MIGRLVNDESENNVDEEQLLPNKVLDSWAWRDKKIVKT